MNMFSRISDIVQANINAMLDKAENPEKVIRLIIQEMEETLVEIRSVAAKNLAEQKHTDRQIRQLTQEAASWENKATLAIEKDREDLARAALTEKHSVMAKISELEAVKAQLDGVIGTIQEDTAKLQGKLAEARAKQKSLLSRQQIGAVRLHAKQVVNSDAVTHAVNRFDHYESRVEALEAQVDAFDVVPSNHALTQEFASLETNDSIESELSALKQKNGKDSAPKTAKRKDKAAA
ncbi:phage shock protein PspA [Alteromonas oceanisediminis]|uniref:phage shock protein PspA n=1 Tax=Alteromonas oceanisediminis TaxID=2836180 RepID=UPI001BDA2767|nr:phage shock protein PspA [Alteromonas oceanisediminis]MBT0585862.1 phage shock protein PspA [Alteromonas oceanisediminis]